MVDRAALLAHAGDNPFTRLMTSAGPVTVHLDDGLVAWVGPGPWGPTGCAVGDTAAAARLFGALRADGGLGEVRRLHFPRMPVEALEPHLTVEHHEDWDFKWLTGPLPTHPAEHRAVPLSPADVPEIGELVDGALPMTHTRPGRPQVRRWWGIRERGRLVACGADRSVGGVGSLAAIAVAADRQGRGLGAGLTTAMSRALLAEFGAVALGVEADNDRAIAVYERVGFTSTVSLTSVSVA